MPVSRRFWLNLADDWLPSMLSNLMFGYKANTESPHDPYNGAAISHFGSDRESKSMIHAIVAMIQILIGARVSKMESPERSEAVESR